MSWGFLGDEHSRLMVPHVKTEEGVYLACGMNSKEASLCDTKGARRRLREKVGESAQADRGGVREVWFAFKRNNLLPLSQGTF